MHQEEKDTLREQIKAVCKKADKGEPVEDPCFRTSDGRFIHCRQTTEAANFHMSTGALLLERYLIEMLWDGHDFVVGCGDVYLEWYINPTVEYLFNRCAANFGEYYVNRSRENLNQLCVMANPLLREEVDEKSVESITNVLMAQISTLDELGTESEMALRNLSVRQLLMLLQAHVLHPWERKRPYVQSAAARTTGRPTEY